METTVGQLLINENLPEDLRDYDRVIDKKAMGALFEELADRYPDQYSEISKRLHTIALRAATRAGADTSLTLESLRTPLAVDRSRAKLRDAVDKVLSGPGSQKKKNQKVIELVAGDLDALTQLNYDEGLAEKNPLVLQVLSGSRGNKDQFRSLRAGDLLVTDHKERPIPLPMLSSYSEGLDPVEYWAGSYGARRGSVATKFCLSGKTLIRMADFTSKRITKIRPGDWVLGADRCGNTFPVRVVALHANGKRTCFRYAFRRRQAKEHIELVATPDHEILSKLKLGRRGGHAHRSWYEPKPAKLQHTRKDFCAVPVQGHIAFCGVREPRAAFMGLMLGDGCMAPSAHGQLSLSCADKSLVEAVAPGLLHMNLELRKASGDNYNWTVCEVTRSKFRWNPATRGVLTGNPTKIWLRELGLADKLAFEKFVPEVVRAWDNQSVAEFIGGLYSADGSVWTTKTGDIRISLALTSRQLIEQVREILELRFGVYTGSIDTRSTKNRQFAKHDLHAIVIAHPVSVARFAKYIPLVGKKKKRLDEALAVYEPSTKQLDISFYFDHKEKVGRIQTYDLEVDHPEHLFVLANGLVVSNSTPKSGFLGKQLAMAAHRLVVTEKDCNTTNGVLFAANDPDNEGAVLASDIGELKTGDVLTPKVLRGLKGKVLLRSPLTCEADQGICQKCAGKRERGSFPPLGDNIGIAAAQGISEPIGQGQLSKKHTGADVSVNTTAKSGLDLVTQLVQVPKTFQGAAAISTVDGTVDAIENAPQGGQYVTVAETQHWVPPGEKLAVGKGDTIEAGDVISSGIPNPAEVTRYKGIGEGRRYFAEMFTKTLAENKFPAHRRNVELLARGLINHVRITDPDGPNDTVPDDVMEYDDLVRGYTPRFGFKTVAPKRAVGLYLEKPALHYSIGTRITPRVAKTLEDNGIGPVTTHVDPPSFMPEMTRAMETLSHSSDWMVRLGGFHLRKGLEESVHRGRKSDVHGVSFIPALAQGVEFGRPPSGVGY